MVPTPFASGGSSATRATSRASGPRTSSRADVVAASDAGTYTSIDVPGATNTYALTINSLNTIAGYYTDSAGSDHGFLLSNGSFTTVDMPGARSTIVFGVNNAGMLVGQYTMRGKVHGFLAMPGGK